MIKKIVLVSVAVLGLAFPSAYAQDAMADGGKTMMSGKKMNVRINPGTTFGNLLIGGFGLSAGFDYAYSPQWTIGLTAGFGTFDSTSIGVKGSNFDVGLRAQYFVESVFADNWYFAPEFQYSNSSVQSVTNVFGVTAASGVDVSVGQFTLGLTAGYMWIWDSGFNIQLGIGPGYSFGFGEVDSTNTSVTDYANGGFTIMTDLSLGYAF